MDMLNDMLRILTIYEVEDFNANPNVPREMEHYARAVLDIPDDEYIMGAMRTSFTKFHRGLIIGRDGIYWLNGPNIETDVNKLTWRELSERKKQIRSLYKKISLGGETMLDSSGVINGNKFIINLIDLLIASYEQQETENDGFVFASENLDILARTLPLNKEELKAENIKIAVEANVSISSLIARLFKKITGQGKA